MNGLVKTVVMVLALFWSGGAVLANSFFLLSTTSKAICRFELPSSKLVQVAAIPEVGDAAGPIHVDRDTLYTFDRAANALIVVSLSTGGVVRSEPLDMDLETMTRGYDIDQNGALCVVFTDGGLQVRTVDSSTGKTSPLTRITGVTAVEAIAFPKGVTNTLFAAYGYNWTSVAKTVTINLSTGAATLVGVGGSIADIDGLTAGDDGFFYGVDSNHGPADMIRMDLRGAFAVIANTGVVGANGIALVRDRFGKGEGSLLTIR